MSDLSNTLILKRIHIDTKLEYVVYMRRNCVIHKSEGFESLSRVKVSVGGRSIVATLNIINDGILEEGEAGLSESAWTTLNAVEGGPVSFSHPPNLESLGHVRSKMYGNRLDRSSFSDILRDIVKGQYSNIEIAAFLTACAGDNLNLDEITGLTEAMVESGERLKWARTVIADKHSVGGLPGNRTTPIIVAIAAEAGLIIPKTSSRAITSPAGTADTMQSITNVDLDIAQIKDITENFNGCFAWGGSIKLSPADDILIRIERALDIDSAGQMIASVLSKKSAAGSTHVLIDIPVGRTAKVRTMESAEKLKYYFNVVGSILNLHVKVIITDGSEPVGRGIGPSLEARDVLAVLKNEKNAPENLRQKSLILAGELLEFTSFCVPGEGYEIARRILESGAAFNRFKLICTAQGGFREPVLASFFIDIKSMVPGTVIEIDNRKIARVAKMAGAPGSPSAGVFLYTPIGTKVKTGDFLYRVYAEEMGQLNYALKYIESQNNIITIA